MSNSFIDSLGITGHLTVHKSYGDAEELIYDEKNVIVSGFGWALAHMYGRVGSTTITDYQIDRFKLGVSGGSELQVSTTTDLSGPLSSNLEYVGEGDSNLEIVSGYRWVSDQATVALEPYAKIPYSKVTKIDDRTVRYTIFVDEDSCNNLSRDGADANLNEIGLFIKNPKANATETSVLAAYRYFTPVRKTDQFALVFRWTISFG